MDRRLIEIAKAFHLGDIVRWYTGVDGALHEKYRIQTTRGNFFIKQFIGKDNDRLGFVYEIEKFLFGKGIPLPLPLAIRNSPWYLLENAIYVVYPFLQNKKPQILEKKHYYTCGMLLAEIHWFGEEYITKYPFVRKKVITKEKDKEELLHAKQILENQTQHDLPQDHGEYLVQSIHQKIKRLEVLEQGSLHDVDTIVHGDFHLGNVLFSEDGDKIVGICDWEKTGYGSRSSELAHSLIASCFAQNLTWEQALDNMKCMLAGYNSYYPISKSQLDNGFSAELYSMTTSTDLEINAKTITKFEVIPALKHREKIAEGLFSGKIQEFLWN